MKKIIIMMLSFLGVSMVYAQLDYNNPKIMKASALGQGQCNICHLCAAEVSNIKPINAKIEKLHISFKKVHKQRKLLKKMSATPVRKKRLAALKEKSKKLMADAIALRAKISAQQKACGAKLPKGMYSDILGQPGACEVCKKCAPEAKILEANLNAQNKLEKSFKVAINSLYTKKELAFRKKLFNSSSPITSAERAKLRKARSRVHALPKYQVMMKKYLNKRAPLNRAYRKAYEPAIRSCATKL